MSSETNPPVPTEASASIIAIAVERMAKEVVDLLSGVLIWKIMLCSSSGIGFCDVSCLGEFFLTVRKPFHTSF